MNGNLITFSAVFRKELLRQSNLRVAATFLGHSEPKPLQRTVWAIVKNPNSCITKPIKNKSKREMVKKQEYVKFIPLFALRSAINRTF